MIPLHRTAPQSTTVAEEQLRIYLEEMRNRTTVPPVSTEDENWCTGCGDHYATSPFRLCPVCVDKAKYVPAPRRLSPYLIGAWL